MGAKAYLALACVCVVTGGCETAKRLAPPGFFKYEDIAGDQPVNPAIEARVEARKQERSEKFPNLSAQPDTRPEGMDAIERALLKSGLNETRDDLDAGTNEDKARALREHEIEQARLEARRAKLEREIARQRRQAAREKAANAKATADAAADTENR